MSKDEQKGYNASLIRYDWIWWDLRGIVPTPEPFAPVEGDSPSAATLPLSAWVGELPQLPVERKADE